VSQNEACKQRQMNALRLLQQDLSRARIALQARAGPEYSKEYA